MKTNDDLADLLEIDKKSLLYFAYSRKNFYNVFAIPKKNGKHRIIYAPVNELKVIQKKIAYILNLIYIPRKNVYGFVKSRDSLENAKLHVKRPYILNIDLKDFFHQFNFGRVRGKFITGYHIGKEAATTLANLLCVKRVKYDGSVDTILPQGAPTSPIISNMICQSFDQDMFDFTKKRSMVYSRYADDIVISSKDDMTISGVISYSETYDLILGESLLNVFVKNGLLINQEKVKLSSKYGRQMITGVVVNCRTNIKHEYISDVRSMLYHCKKDGIHEAANHYAKKKGVRLSRNQKNNELWFKNVISGKIRYIGYITNHRGYYYDLALKANSIFKENIFDLSGLFKEKDIAESNVFIIEDEKGEGQGTAFMVPGCGLFTCCHVLKNITKGEYYSSFTISNTNGRNKIPIRSGVVFDRNKNPFDSDGDYALFLDVDDMFPESKHIKIGESGKLSIGDKVILIGYPDYSSGTYSRISTEIMKEGKFLEIPACIISEPIRHGFSGGIVLNKDNEVVGMVAFGTSAEEDNANIGTYGFIPIDFIRNSIKDIYGIDIKLN